MGVLRLFRWGFGGLLRCFLGTIEVSLGLFKWFYTGTSVGFGGYFSGVELLKWGFLSV